MRNAPRVIVLVIVQYQFLQHGHKMVTISFRGPKELQSEHGVPMSFISELARRR